MNFCNAYGLTPSDAQLDQLEEVMRQAFLQARYTVKDEEKVEEGYYLEVEIDPIVNFSGLEDQVAQLRSEAEYEATQANSGRPTAGTTPTMRTTLTARMASTARTASTGEDDPYGEDDSYDEDDSYGQEEDREHVSANTLFVGQGGGLLPGAAGKHPAQRHPGDHLPGHPPDRRRGAAAGHQQLGHHRPDGAPVPQLKEGRKRGGLGPPCFIGGARRAGAHVFRFPATLSHGGSPAKPAAGFPAGKGIFQMEEEKKLCVNALYDLSHTAAAPLLEKVEYPWEALPEIGAFIRQLGETLSPEEYERRGEDVWIHKTAKIYPNNYIAGPCVIGPETEVRPGAFYPGQRPGGGPLRGGQFHRAEKRDPLRQCPGAPLQLRGGLHFGI